MFKYSFFNTYCTNCFHLFPWPIIISFDLRLILQQSNETYQCCFLKKSFSSQSKSKEDIKRRHEDINFIFEWWWKQYFMNEQSEWVKYCFHHEKIKFMSSAIHRVMFFLLYGNNTINVQFGLSHMIDIFTIVKWYKKYLTVYIYIYFSVCHSLPYNKYLHVLHD